ncbi:hypothetical protein [Novosphingobium sp. JCM 18896]|uniref:hypothetical protein n=1 Tax=Novosphingobium sp. JCM 18896 TaxID=2989731 RepID=UPI0022232B46|nr:hypothetical protein [Novosphingobium sp. JCM 18896]MCW1429348.1 hypothetical protein [Novosphingobium sp. JCM 18896]
MGDQNNSFDSVRRLIERLASAPVCDVCIAERLDLAPGEPVELHTHELAGIDGFAAISTP